jgi:ribosomal protein S17E
MEYQILDLFKVMVITEDQKNSKLNLNLADRGIVLDFDPTPSQMVHLKSCFEPLQLKTLFTVNDIENSSSELLMAKQILHYIEVYGLRMPGLFNLEVDCGEVVTVNYIKGVTKSELGDMVRKLIYRNAPIADVTTVAQIINEYDVFYDLAKVANNEAKMMLFSENRDVFDNGDDAVRYICYQATGSTMLIKSKEVIDAVRVSRSISTDFIEKHKLVLAQVFNRHKKIIMALKSAKTRTVINQITRLSKTAHVPIKESLSKVLVTRALEDKRFNTPVALLNVSPRDMFKYLNLLAYKKLQLDVDSFVIRNGKIHIKEGRKSYTIEDILCVENAILDNLRNHFNTMLYGKTIVLDKNVDYGLPVSRKQTVGQLPFGTEVTVDGRISSGIYWRDEWGARDLDLSTIDMEGNRLGWGYPGFRRGDIKFSGDLTSAYDGAMEFMTSQKSTYGLFTNIYSGQTGCGAEIVCGTEADGHWIKDVIIREKVTLNSRGIVTGFVRDNKFIVYLGRLNNRAANFGERNPVLNRASCEQWTVRKLFDRIGVNYSVDKSEEVDYNLTYTGFSFDKLEALLLA